MHQYLQDTEFAAKSLFSLVTDEAKQLKALSLKLHPLEQQLKFHQWDFQTSDLNDDFTDGHVMAAFRRAAMTGLEVARLKGQVAVVQASVGTRQHSIQAIAGSIFQLAKQGISLVYGEPNLAPPGRMVGSLAIRGRFIQEGTFRPLPYA